MTIEVDGTLWKPRPGATASADEFIAARSLIMEIQTAARWSPWVQEDRAGDYDTATAVFGQWTRAERDFRQKTAEEYEAEQEQWWASLDARVEAETTRSELERTARKADHDPERARVRLALLEQQASLASVTREHDGITARQLFPAMPEDRRWARVAGLDASIAATRVAVEELSRRVGDAEAVVDKHGWLPSERRELALDIFAARRDSEVRGLRERIASQGTVLRTTKGRPERARIREDLRKDSHRLSCLQAIPPMAAADMCSECVSPAAWHDPTIKFCEAGQAHGPCPAWPLWQQRLQKCAMP